MTTWLHGIGIIQNVAVLVITFLAPVAGVAVQPQTSAVAPQGTAIVSESVPVPFNASTSEPISGFVPTSTDSTASSSIASSTGVAVSSADVANSLSLELATITPGLLPKTHLLPFKQTTIVATQNTKPTPPPTPAPAPAPETLPKDVSADWLIGRTTLSFKERRDGPYDAVLSTDLGNKKIIQWGLSDATIGGDRSLPQFAVSFSCDPPPEAPSPDDSDQQPFFKVGIGYRCDIALAALTGSDRRARPKHFSFTTDPGSVLVRPSSAMSGVLTNDKNSGGFVFTNRDKQPVSVTGLTFDVSLTGLNTLDSPLILRFIDGRTEQTLFEYHLENLPKGALPYTQSQTSIAAPLSLDLDAESDRMLTVQVVGVHRFSISGVDPTIKVTVASVHLGRSNVKSVINSAQIFWSCVVSLAQYNPNSTSTPSNVCRG